MGDLVEPRLVEPAVPERPELRRQGPRRRLQERGR